MERLFVFCLTWSFTSLLEPEDRAKYDVYIRGAAGAACPPESDTMTIYDYALLKEEDYSWGEWDVPPLGVKPGEDFSYASLLVPTMDGIRAEFIINTCLTQKRPVLLVGGPGTAKTSIVLQYIAKQNKDETLFKRVNFSSATTPQIFQNIIEASIDKRSAKSFGPPANKKTSCFPG